MKSLTHGLILGLVLLLGYSAFGQVKRVGPEHWREKYETEQNLEGSFKVDMSGGLRLISFYQPVSFPSNVTTHNIFSRFWAPESDKEFFQVSREKRSVKGYTRESKPAQTRKGWNYTDDWDRRQMLDRFNLSPRDLSFLTHWGEAGSLYFLPTQVSFHPTLAQFSRDIYVFDLKVFSQTTEGAYHIYRGLHSGLKPISSPILKGKILGATGGSVVTFYLSRPQLGSQSGWYTMFLGLPQYGSTEVLQHRVYFYHYVE